MWQVHVAPAGLLRFWLDDERLDISGVPVPAVVVVGEGDEPGDCDPEAERELGVINLNRCVLGFSLIQPSLLNGDPVGGNFLQRFPAVRAAEFAAEVLGVFVVALPFAILHLCAFVFSPS